MAKNRKAKKLKIGFLMFFLMIDKNGYKNRSMMDQVDRFMK